MDVRLETTPILSIESEAILVLVLEGSNIVGTVQVLNEALNGAVNEVIEMGDFTRASGEISVLYTHGAIAPKRLILAGLGPAEKFSLDHLRRTAAKAVQKAVELQVNTLATTLDFAELLTHDVTQVGEALVEGALLGLYRYHGQKTSDAPDDLPRTLVVQVEESAREPVHQAMQRAQAIASGANLARDLVNLPANICDPAYLSAAATQAGESTGLRVEVLERKQIEALGMGAFLGVAQGSETAPRCIIMEHNADKADEFDSIVLVGKGVTFDTGGYSLKTRDSMVGMKADMGGGAAVIGAMQAIGALNPPLHVVGLVPAADNMISGRAYRPQDVIKASNGVTIEIISTDAEGRLLLADALVFSSRYKPAAVVDIATLTGSCVTALGSAAAGLFSISDPLRDLLMAASERSGERLWPMPLFPEYDKAIESHTADIKNSGGSKSGVGTSAAFLKRFVDVSAWAHLDIAGMAGIEGMSRSENPYVPDKGGTGFGARLLVDFVRHWPSQ